MTVRREQGVTGARLLDSSGDLFAEAVARLLSDAPVGFAVLDAELRYQHVNDRLAAINGSTPSEHVGRTVGDLVPGVAPEAEVVFRRVLETGVPLREAELSGEVPGSPGVVRHWLASVYPLWGSTSEEGPGGARGLAVLVWEVSSRVEAERARADMLAMLDVLIARAPVGIAFLDADLRYVRINETLAAVNGLPVADHLGRRVAEVLPDVAPDVVPLLQRVLSTGDPVRDLPLETGPTPGEPGRRRHWRVSYYPVPAGTGDDPSRPAGLGLIVTDETELVAADRERARLLDAERGAARAALEAAGRTTVLQQVTAALARTLTEDEVAAVVVGEVRDLLGAEAATVQIYDAAHDPDALTVLAATGITDEVAAVGQRLSLASTSLGAAVIRGRRPVLVESTAERDRLFPDLAGSAGFQSVRQQAWANLPLIIDGRTVGIAAFGWVTPRTFEPETVDLLTALATQCATALQRARLHRAERTARQRLDLLARAGEALAASLDEEAVLDAITGLLVPECGDWLSVLLPDGSGGLVTRRSTHADPALAHLTDRLRSTTPLPVDGDAPASYVFRTGRPLATGDITPYLRQEAGTPPDVAALAHGLTPTAGLLVPLTVRGRTVGVLSLVNTTAPGQASHPGRLVHDLPGELDLVNDLARRAAAALDNARLFGQRSRIASRLQETLLPARLPTIPGVDLAVRYATAEDAVEVGGDFYDVIPLPDQAGVSGAHTHLLVIGDVSGRGVDAAGTTGLARHTLHALAHLDPAEALARLDGIVRAQSATERFLTAALVRLSYRPTSGTSDWTATVAVAGHPAPLLLRGDGTTEPLESEGSLLGIDHAGATNAIEQRTYALRPGDTLVLFTDGITEARRGLELYGEERLAATLHELCSAPPGDASCSADDVADGVLAAVDAFRSAPADDDSALIVVRIDRRALVPPRSH